MQTRSVVSWSRSASKAAAIGTYGPQTRIRGMRGLSRSSERVRGKRFRKAENGPAAEPDVLRRSCSAPRSTDALRQSAINQQSAIALRDRNVFAQVHVLDRVQETDAFLERTLERLAARDQPHAA